MKYFQDCKDMDEAKKLYYKLAMQNHPDRGGDPEIMKAINNEYDFFCGKTIRDENLTAEETEQRREHDEMYRMIIEKIIVIEGIVIEIIGAWICVRHYLSCSPAIERRRADFRG